jgi:hypothetical protein
MPAQIERLVAGELSEPARGPVIAWLDEQPSRWRMCGLLFLEAQTWSQALAEWSQRPAPLGRLPTELTAARRSNLGGRRLRDVVVLAASVLIAFTVGFVMREAGVKPAADAMIAKESVNGSAEQPSTDQGNAARLMPVMATMSMASGLSGLSRPAVQIPVVPRNASQGEQKAAHDSIPDYVRQQWERRGYRLDVERRYLFAKLPDGEPVAVPVEQYFIKRIPPKIN